MGRNPDPRGKDRPRTIVLSGDVAEIAQKLADQQVLSKTLSELLRSAYGFGDAINEKKRALELLIAERESLQEQEEGLIRQIDAMEDEAIEQATTIRPALESKIEILQIRYNRINIRLQRAFDKQTRARLMKQHDETFRLLKAAREELEAME